MTEPSPLEDVRQQIEAINLVRAVLDGTESSFEINAGTCIGMAKGIINILQRCAVREGKTDPQELADYVRDSLKAAEDSVTVHAFRRELAAFDE